MNTSTAAGVEAVPDKLVQRPRRVPAGPLEDTQQNPPVELRPPEPPGPLPPISVRPVPSMDPGAGIAPVIRLTGRTRKRMLPAPPAPPGNAVVLEMELAEEARRITGIVRSVGQAIVEILGGTRPIAQLARWLDPQSFERLSLRAALIRDARGRTGCTGAAARAVHRNPLVRTVRVCRTAAGVYEASAVITEQQRARALALRLELRGEIWKITAIELG